jgi:hypothetical protein
LPNYHQGTVLFHLSTTYHRICIQHMEPQQIKKHQKGWCSTTSSRQVCHWRLPAHKQCHSHVTATPVADTTRQRSMCIDSDDVSHQSHLSLNQRPFTTISCMTHKNYSAHDIILQTRHTPLEPTTWKCGGSRQHRQLQVSALYGNSHLNLKLLLSF